MLVYQRVVTMINGAHMNIMLLLVCWYINIVIYDWQVMTML